MSEMESEGAMCRLIAAGALLAVFLISNFDLLADEVDDHLAAIAQVGPNGAGSEAARKARAALSGQEIAILPRLLTAMDTPNLVAANWYRTIYEDVLARELAKPEPQLPLGFCAEYVRNPERQGRARRLVLALLESRQPGTTSAFLKDQLNDREFRSEAVELTLRTGDAAKAAGDTAGAKAAYQKGFHSARDAEQIRAAAGRLAGVGTQVSIVKHMGFMTEWYLLGPFDAPEYSGFAKVFPPEEKVDLNAEYKGKAGTPIRWKRFSVPDAMGQMNLIDAIDSAKEAVGYAYTEFESPRDQAVQMRCGADDNCSVWINGKKIFGRDQWLNGTRLDRFVAPAHLVAGKNVMLVKICQGPQHKDPEVPNNWSLQLRLCDAEGAGVDAKSILPPVPIKASQP